MKRGAPLQRKTRLRPKPLPEKELWRRDAVRREVFERDNYLCQMQGWRGECYGPLTFHHVRKASQTGKYEVGNGLTACVRHNDLIETYPLEAREKGWVK